MTGRGAGRGPAVTVGEGAGCAATPVSQSSNRYPAPAWRLTVPTAQPGGTCVGPWGGSADLPYACVMGGLG